MTDPRHPVLRSPMPPRVLLPLLGGLAACAVGAIEVEVSIASAGNACPSDSAKLTSIAACRAAIDLLGYDGEDYEGDEDELSWPSGCYFCDGVSGCTNGFWFNSHATGAANGDAAPVCASGLEVGGRDNLDARVAGRRRRRRATGVGSEPTWCISTE